MALNVSIFKTRALTALVFVVVMLVGLLWNQWSFLILFSIIHFGCWYEYQKLVAQIDPGYLQITPYHKYGVMLAGWCIMLYFTNDHFFIGSISLKAIGKWGGLLFLFILPILEILLVQKINLKNIGHSAFGLIYISLSLGLLTDMRTHYESALEFVNKLLMIMIIGSIWINDTMAYLLGSMFGKTPLTPISPKKTWEGTIAGILSSILIMGTIGYFMSTELDWEIISQWTIIAAIASIAGTYGDLLQSKMKRMANVKDSGNIMPGHGGFLDRFDSLLLASPFVWIFVNFFIW